MCGILGSFGSKIFESEVFFRAISLQSNRGPDSLDIVYMENAQLGHARLAIHDLSSEANQPMYHSSGRYIIIFNGEIYNFRELKKQLDKGVDWQTDSDTEVLLEYLISFGVEITLSKVEGMFAFAFYDILLGEVIVARDQFGEKPLYYSLDDNNLVVSSSLYSIVSLIGISGLNAQSLSNYMHYGYTKGERTLIENIYKLKPSTFLKYNLNSKEHSLCSYLVESRGRTLDVQDINSLGKEINTSVEQCLDADVPVGCFLSGGIDSSLITAYAASLTDSKIKAFCLGFEDKNYDESHKAKAVADFLGVDIDIVYVSNDDLLTALRETKNVFDEPFADASYLATYILCKYARKQVTVCLSGDGGDELFSGYNRHVLMGKLYPWVASVPHIIRAPIFRAFSEKKTLNSTIKWLAKYINNSNAYTAFNEKIDKFLIAMQAKDKGDLFFRIVAGDDISKQLGLPEPFKHEVLSIEPRDLAMLDMSSYLHEDVLVKVDRTSMASSLECRAPLLNNNIKDFSLSCSDDYHFDGNNQKVALRHLLYKLLPESLFKGKKAGFSVPYESLIRGPLRTEFDVEFNKLQGSIFDGDIMGALKCYVEMYYNGSVSDSKYVWNIYCLIIWLSNVLAVANKNKN